MSDKVDVAALRLGSWATPIGQRLDTYDPDVAAYRQSDDRADPHLRRRFVDGSSVEPNMALAHESLSDTSRLGEACKAEKLVDPKGCVSHAHLVSGVEEHAVVGVGEERQMR